MEAAAFYNNGSRKRLLLEDENGQFGPILVSTIFRILSFLDFPHDDHRPSVQEIEFFSIDFPVHDGEFRLLIDDA